MIELLAAGFPRLFRSKLFRLSMIGMFVTGILIVLIPYFGARNLGVAPDTIDQMLYFPTLVLPFLLAALCGLFIGTEYNDGTLRRKLTVGAGRVPLYFSTFLLALAAGVLLYLAFLVSFLALALPLRSPAELALPVLLRYGALAFLHLAAFVSLFTMMAMLIPNRSIGVVAALLFTVLLFFGAVLIINLLDVPEFLPRVEMTINGQSYVSEETPNPRYVRGFARQLLQFLDRTLPGAQMTWIPAYGIEQPVLTGVASAVQILAANAVGLFLFRKKDIQ